jgi:predicted Zn-dependent protease
VGTAADLDDDEQQALMMGSLVSAGLVGMKYSRRAESEADLLGMQYMWKAGWDPEGIAEFFRVLEAESGPSGPGWLSTHPTHETRVRNGVHWSRTFLPERERYLVSSDEFEAIQEYVRALPPPRKDGAAQGKGLMELVEESPSYQRYMSRQLEGILMEPSPER